MQSKITKQSPKVVFYLVQKTLRDLFDGIFVNDPGVERMKLLLEKKVRVVLMPVYKSFLDFLILVYSLVVNSIELPFTVGN
jgi:glycerol-3-phosphate O-acyltransferase